MRNRLHWSMKVFLVAELLIVLITAAAAIDPLVKGRAGVITFGVVLLAVTEGVRQLVRIVLEDARKRAERNQ